MENCIFCKIIRGEIPSARYYEDDDMIVIKDIEPKAKLHYLCIPKEHFALLSEMDDKKAELLKRCFEKIAGVAGKTGTGRGISHHRQSGTKRRTERASSAHSFARRRKADGILTRLKFSSDRFCDIFVKILDNCVGKSV